MHTIGPKTESNGNEVILTAIAKLAINTISKVSGDKSDILYSPSTLEELESNTGTLSTIVALKLKNNLVKN